MEANRDIRDRTSCPQSSRRSRDLTPFKLIRAITLTVCERLRLVNQKVSATLSPEMPAAATAPATAAPTTAAPTTAAPQGDKPGLLGKLFRKKGQS